MCFVIFHFFFENHPKQWKISIAPIFFQNHENLHKILFYVHQNGGWRTSWAAKRGGWHGHGQMRRSAQTYPSSPLPPWPMRGYQTKMSMRLCSYHIGVLLHPTRAGSDDFDFRNLVQLVWYEARIYHGTYLITLQRRLTSCTVLLSVWCENIFNELLNS